MINEEIKKMLSSFKNAKLTANFDKVILELYQKIHSEIKNRLILNTFYGTEKNKYNGYLQKGDIFALGVTMYDFLDYYNNDFISGKSSKPGTGIGSKLSNSSLNNSKLLDLLENMININPQKRYNVEQCLNHPYFTNK